MPESLISFQPVWQIWIQQPVFCLTQLLFLIGGIITFLHAYLNGKKWLCTLFTITACGAFVEILTFIVPSMNNFWHSQSLTMLWNRRFPVHVLFIYPLFYYSSMVAVSSLDVSRWSRPFAVGILATLVDIPYDIIGVKFVQWTWHDTDPNIYDRAYWVPLTSYYFHSVFPACITALKPTKGRRFVTTVLLAFPLCCLAFSVFYHPMHDYLLVHTGAILIFLFSFYATAILLDVWRKESLIRQPRTRYNHVLKIYLLLYYTFFVLVAAFGKPENEKSEGYHQEIGPCDVTEPVYTISGKILNRKKYLCLTDYDEKYFDFHCVPGKKYENYTKWYTICGTPYTNRTQYILIISAVSMLASVLFSFLYQTHSRSKIKLK